MGSDSGPAVRSDRISTEMTVAGQAFWGIALVLLPSVSMLLGLPLMWAIWSEVLTGRVALTALDPWLWGYSLVVWAALLAVPGYFVAAFEAQRLLRLSSPGRWWIRVSLTAGMLAAVVATPLTFFFSRWLWLFPVGTLACCLAMVLRTERCWRSGRDRASDAEI